MEKILIVDDDEQLLLILTEILGNYKDRFEVVPVTSGFEAIRAMQENKFAMLVTDLIMPGINGHVLLSYVAKNFPSMPCIVMTGFGSPEIKASLKQKATRYLQKPFSVTDLGDMIISILGQDEDQLLGTMNGVSIEGFLNLVEAESMTCICEIRSKDGKTGYLVFEGGTLHNATYGRLTGKEAAVELFKFDRVRIKFRNPPKKKFPRKISRTVSSLLKEAKAA